MAYLKPRRDVAQRNSVRRSYGECPRRRHSYGVGTASASLSSKNSRSRRPRVASRLHKRDFAARKCPHMSRKCPHMSRRETRSIATAPLHQTLSLHHKVLAPNKLRGFEHRPNPWTRPHSRRIPWKLSRPQCRSGTLSKQCPLSRGFGKSWCTSDLPVGRVLFRPRHSRIRPGADAADWFEVRPIALPRVEGT